MIFLYVFFQFSPQPETGIIVDNEIPEHMMNEGEEDGIDMDATFITILMTSQNGSYGLQVIGGVDTALTAQVEMVVPG